MTARYEICARDLGRNVMPLIIEGGRVPPRWAERKPAPLAGSVESCVRGSGVCQDCIHQ